MTHPYQITRSDEGRTFITAFVGGVPYVADDTHPQFTSIERVVRDPESSDQDVIDAFDLGEAIASRFHRLSDRVTVANGEVYLDGDVMHNALTNQILRSLETDDPDQDFRAFVAFLERIETNPSERSREQLFTWLDARDFTITHEGLIVAYKGVQDRPSSLERPARYESVTSGSTTVIVNDERVTGRVPQDVGSVVEVPRSEVDEDPRVGCSYGLHVGTYDYASGWARGALLKVLVDPRDVVSVPQDSEHQKVRTCRYKVIEVIEAPETAPVVYDYNESEDEVSISEMAAVEAEWIASCAEHGVDLEDAQRILEGVNLEQGIDFYYQGENDDQPEFREISPYGVFVAANGYPYVYGSDQYDNDQVKQFRIDRIEEHTVDVYDAAVQEFVPESQARS